MTGHCSKSEIIVISSPYGPLALSREMLISAIALGKEIAAPVVTSSEGDGTASSAKLMDANQVGRELGVDSSWLLKRARENRVPHYRIGKYVRFDVSEVRAVARRGGD